MNLFIYVLLLSIWTNSYLDTNQSNESSTAGAKHHESMQTKMDNFRKHLLIIVTGIIIIAFVFTCLCFLHYNCMSDEVPKEGRVKKKGVKPKSSRSSKILVSDSKTASLCGPEKQSMLSSIDKLPGRSSPETASIPSSAEKLIKPSSQEKSCKAASPKKGFRSSCQGKSHRTRSLDKARKRAHAHKVLSQVSSSYPSEAVRPPSWASLQHPVSPTNTPCPSYPQNQILSNPPSLPKLTKPHRHHKLKSSVNTRRAERLSRPQPVQSCQCYKEKCLIYRAASGPLVHNISEAKKKNAQIPPFPHKLKPFPKMDSRDNVLCGNASDHDMLTYDSDDDSDREITIICNMQCKEFIY
uniref:Uncharacterized protein n=1 Tax=Catagonus wagneri TaxID=51154 RepID=A0A8C3WHE9_9CETA